jgi:hypothetical protein
MAWWYYCQVHGWLKRATDYSGMYPPNELEKGRLRDMNASHREQFKEAIMDTNSYHRMENCHVVLVFRQSTDTTFPTGSRIEVE